jgi:hypothetical protein
LLRPRTVLSIRYEGCGQTLKAPLRHDRPGGRQARVPRRAIRSRAGKGCAGERHVLATPRRAPSLTSGHSARLAGGADRPSVCGPLADQSEGWAARDSFGSTWSEGGPVPGWPPCRCRAAGRPGWMGCASTTFGTQRWRSGSPPAPTPTPEVTVARLRRRAGRGPVWPQAARERRERRRW